MFKKNTGYLILVLLLLIILMIIIEIFSGKKTITDKSNGQRSPKPTSEITLGRFYVTGSDINNRELGVTEGFRIIFSKPISQPIYTIEPNEPVNVSNESGSSLKIEPKQAWKFNTSYTLTIKKGSAAQDGSLLNEDYVANFHTNPYTGL